MLCPRQDCLCWARAPTLPTLCPRHGRLSLPPPLRCISKLCPRHGVPTSWHPYLTYAVSRHSGHSFPPPLPFHILCPRHGGLSILPPLPYIRPPLLHICCARDTVASNSYLYYLIHAIPETRWSLIPIALPYIRYARDSVVSNSHCTILIYTVPKTRRSQIPTATPWYMYIYPIHSGLSFPTS